MSEIEERMVERVQYYWKCPECEMELKGNGKKTLEHHRRMHEKEYCKGKKE